MKREKKKNPAFAESRFSASSFEISEHLLTYRTGETNPSCNWKVGKEGRGLKINKKVLWDYFRTYRADQRVKCETAQRAKFGYIHDVSLGKERLQGPRSATLSAPTPNTLIISTATSNLEDWQPQSWWNCPTMAHAYALRNAWQSPSLCRRGKKHSGQTPALHWRWTRKAPPKEATSKKGQEVGGSFLLATSCSLNSLLLSLQLTLLQELAILRIEGKQKHCC